jgi:hypothetical protein
MKRQLVYRIWWLTLLMWGGIFAGQSLAQTITVGTTSLSPCMAAGSTVSVQFTTTGSFSATNQFTVQVVNAATSYVATVGVVSTTAGSTVSGTIPANIPVGGGYVIRVVSSAPVITSGSSVAFGINPPAPSASITAPTAGPICPTVTPVTLTANGISGSSIRWYSSGGTFLVSSATYNPPTAQVGSTSYFASQTVGGCEGPRGTVVVTVSAKSPQPIANPPAYCQGLAGQPPVTGYVTGSNLKWYLTANVPAPNNTPDPVLVSSPGIRSYIVTQTSNGCESDPLTFNVTVNPKPGVPTASSPTVCQNAAQQTLSASGSNGASFQWYDSNDVLLSGSGAAPRPATTSPGVNTYKVDQTVLGCRSDKTTITFTVRTAPAAPSAASIVYCEANRPASLTPPAGTIQWFSDAAGSQAIGQPAPPSSANTYTYYVRSVDGNSCSSVPSSYVVRVAATPGQPALTTDLSRCQGETARVLTATGNAGNLLNWFDVNLGVLPGAPTPPTSTVGSQTYFVSQTNSDNCVSSRATATVTVKPTPNAPGVNTPISFCQNYGAPQLNASPVSGASLLWYGQNATGGAPTGTATTPANNASGTFAYYVSQTLNGCESFSRAKIDVTVKRTPGAPSVITPVSFCQNSSAPILNANPESGAALLWYGTNATGGTAGSNAPNPPNNIATTYNYYASQSLDGCESLQRARIDVNVKRTPIQPAVTPVSFCQFTNAPSLQALGEGNSTLLWYGQSQTGGTASGNTPGVANDVAGNFTYYVSQSVNDCESPRAGLSVRVKAKPGQPGTNALNYCVTQQDQPNQNVGPLTANGQNLRWFNSDGNGFQSAPTPPIDRVQTINFLVSQTIDDCESDRATVRVTVQATPTPVLSSSLVTYCQTTQSIPLTATAETGGSLRWIDPFGTVTNTAPTPPTLNATKPGGEFFYVFQVGANGCYSARNPIRVVVNTTPTLSLLGSTTVNLGLRANLQLRFTGVPPYSYALTDGTNIIDSGISADTLATVAVMPARTTTYQVASVTNVCGKGLPGNPATTIVSVLIPVITTGILTSTALCGGANFSVPFSVAGVLNPGNVFQVQVADTLSKNFVPASLTTASTNPIVATLPSSLSAGYYFVRVIGTNPGIAVLGQNSTTRLLVRAFPTAQLSGSQSVYQGSSAKLSVALTGDSPWTFVWADSTTRTSVSTSANPHLIDVTPVRTRSYSLVSVANNCGNGTVGGTATITILPLLAVDDPLAASVTIYPVPTAATLTVDIDRSLLMSPATLQLTDITGRTTLERTTQDHRTTLDLGQQPAGLYLLRVKVGEQTMVRRVLKL